MATWWETKEKAIDAMAKIKSDIVHSLKITPEMRQAIGAAKFHPFADLPGPK